MAYWIIIVDDDTSNLQMAGHILSRNDMRVTALLSGGALLDYVSSKGQPSLILLDINMPEMDGFETLRRLRAWEHETGADETPVIFLTADEGADTEQQGFEAGVSDYIRKPFHPDILLRRINNIVAKQNTIRSLKAEAATDRLTGLLNKAAASEEMPHLCAERDGCLLMVDLDAFKLVNDIYGHEAGDRVLIRFSELISENTPAGSKCARIGGDEFAAFCEGMREEAEVAALASLLNDGIGDAAKELLGEDMRIPLGASVGAVFVPEQGRDYEALLKRADKALYAAKQSGKHCYRVYSAEAFAQEDSGIRSIENDLLTLSAILGERNIPDSAQHLDRELFSGVYQYIMRYIVRNQRKACKVLFNISSGAGTGNETYDELCTAFGEHIKNRLRKSDILMRCRYNQYFVLLADIHEASVHTVIGNIINSWRMQHGEAISISYVTELVGGMHGYSGSAHEQHRVLIADRSTEDLRAAGEALSEGGFYVTAVRTGAALLARVPELMPDLILIAVDLPDADGFEVLRSLRAAGGEAADIPVLFLTERLEPEILQTGLTLGAADLIAKPFSGPLLLNRVRHIVELNLLRRSMSLEVERIARENRQRFAQVLRCYADSAGGETAAHMMLALRTAESAADIAKLAGLSAQQQGQIYTDALLCGAGDSADGENHFSDSAEEKILAVAAAYAKASDGTAFSADEGRAEILRGRGTRFDPYFADILLSLTDGDADSARREE